VVIPHGPLHHVPFAALTLDSVPLLERMVVARALSASMLADRLAGPVRPPVRRVVAVATGADLPFAPLEARAIAGRAAVIGAGATEQLVRTARADALDVAAHTELDVREPLGSAIVLSPAGNDDGRLEVSEVFALTSLPPLVSLSACDSHGSDVEGGEWLGLGGAFLTAGVQTVVASSSRVSDLAAAVVMKRFYRAVRSRPAGEALRQAALSARRYFPHPAHWASFVLLGDFR
jgi:CHAT domain-containing protein